MTKHSLGRNAFRHPYTVLLPVIFILVMVIVATTTDSIGLQVAGTMVLVTTAVVGTAFLLIYALVWRLWVEKREGRTIISLLSTLIFFIDYIAMVALGWLRFDYPLHVRFIMYSGLFIVIYWQLALMVSRQLEARRERRESKLPPQNLPADELLK